MDRHAYVDDFPAMDGCVVCGRASGDPVHGERLVDILPLDALGFAQVARNLGAIAHDLALRIPSYRGTSPTDDGTTRTIRRDPAGPVVSVVLRDRPARDVKLDMAEGLCEANNLHHDHPKRWMILDRMELT